MSTAANYHKKAPEHKMRSDIAVLVSMCIFTFLVLGGFVANKLLPESDIKFGAVFQSYFEKGDDTAFKVGTVKLGTTIDRVRNRHANAVKGITADGAITLSFLDGTDRYMVWYGENGPNHVAYKARQSREIKGVTEDDFIGSIAERYGAPSLSSCSRRIVDGLRDCQFSWWIPGEIRLDINSRQNPRALTPSLKVTMQMTDTRQEGRMRRTAQRTETLKSY